jgi:hypothetical protein
MSRRLSYGSLCVAGIRLCDASVDRRANGRNTGVCSTLLREVGRGSTGAPANRSSKWCTDVRCVANRHGAMLAAGTI